jgi:hypothetical protein
MRLMNTTPHTNAPLLPLLRRARTLIAMGTVGLALVAAGPASAEPSKPVTTKKKVATDTTTPPPSPDRGTFDIKWEVTVDGKDRV